MHKEKLIKKNYLTSCVQSRAAWIYEMVDNAKEICYKTLLKHIEYEEILNLFPCYAKDKRQGLTIKDDWHVRFYKSKYRGKPCVYIKHSAIEYIFC